MMRVFSRSGAGGDDAAQEEAGSGPAKFGQPLPADSNATDPAAQPRKGIARQSGFGRSDARIEAAPAPEKEPFVAAEKYSIFLDKGG